MADGIRSLQIHYDPNVLALDTLLAHLEGAERELRDVGVDRRVRRQPWLHDGLVRLLVQHVRHARLPQALRHRRDGAEP